MKRIHLRKIGYKREKLRKRRYKIIYPNSSNFVGYEANT